MNIKTFTQILVIILIFSCNENHNKNTIIEGSISKVVYEINNSHSYQLFLPGNYNAKNKYPLIVCFDPHANGNIPVDSLKDIANKLGYIVAGSNVIQNNYSNLEYAVTTLFNDIENRYSINNKRIYTCGFSGGGRIASMLAIQRNDVNAAISCGAGLPNINYGMVNKKINFYLISGVEDFNYYEIIHSQNHQNISKHNISIDIFNDGHKWPPIKILADAVNLLELSAMQQGIVSKNKQFIKEMYNNEIIAIQEYKNNENFEKLIYSLEKNIISFDGMHRTSYFINELDAVLNSSKYKEFKKDEKLIQKQEIALRHAYIEAFTNKDLNWWKNEINTLSNYKLKFESKLKHNMYCRLLNFLSMAGYTFSNESLNKNDEKAFEKNISIYELVDPENADVYYLKAQYYFQKNNNNMVISNLNKALKMGFNDIEKLKTDFSEKISQLIDN